MATDIGALSRKLGLLLALKMNDSLSGRMVGCNDEPSLSMDKMMTSSSEDANSSNSNSTDCSLQDGLLLKNIFEKDIPYESSAAQLFFTYFTPVVFVVGVVGNLLSLIVFLSKNMKKLSASIYLAALSTSDLLALFFYVLTEWLKHGLPLLPGHVAATFLQEHGTCQIMLYFQYISRFLSSWLVVCFTVERYIGVCHPLRRKGICDSKSASRLILALVVVSAVLCLFKPILSGSYTAINGDPLCTSRKDKQYISFILDSGFGVAITLIPFVLITVLNLLIIRKLILRNKRHRKLRVVTEDSIIRLEFTFILLAISICFVSLNLPYFCVWCKRYWTYKKIFNLNDAHIDAISQQDSHINELDDILMVTRTIFYINYCINFFLYSITGAYFRKELRHLFLHKDRRTVNHFRRYSAYSRTNSQPQTTSTPHSWV